MFGFDIVYFGSRTAIVLPLGTAVAAMLLGRRWGMRTEVVAACLFLAVLGALYCTEPTFFFSW